MSFSLKRAFMRTQQQSMEAVAEPGPLAAEE